MGCRVLTQEQPATPDPSVFLPRAVASQPRCPPPHIHTPDETPARDSPAASRESSSKLKRSRRRRSQAFWISAQQEREISPRSTGSHDLHIPLPPLPMPCGHKCTSKQASVRDTHIPFREM